MVKSCTEKVIEKPDNGKKYCERLCCSTETKNMIMTDCVEEFLSHHPELAGMKITQDFILRKIIDFYLKQ